MSSVLDYDIKLLDSTVVCRPSKKINHHIYWILILK